MGVLPVLLAAAALEVGPAALVDPATARGCESGGSSRAVMQCLTDALKTHQPTAVAFIEQLGGEGYLHGFDERGPVDVAHVTYPFRGNATRGVLLVNGTPAVVDVNDPAQYKGLGIRKHPRYAELAAGGDMELWADDPGRPSVDVDPSAGRRFRFTLPLKSCRACKPAGFARVVFEFDDRAVFRGVTLDELRRDP
jgi:hypothetical protein